MSSLLTLSKVVFRRSQLEQTKHWSRPKLQAYQVAEVAKLREFAKTSPFYRRFHRGMEGRPFKDLPVLTKDVMMENFDEFVTDRSIRLKDVRAHLASASVNSLFQGKYVVLSTSGSSGLPGIFLYDQSEWINMAASFSRAMLWAGLAPSPIHPKRIATVTTTAPFHYSSRMGETLKSKFANVTRIDVSSPISEIVRELNECNPQVLGGYPSVLRQLAVEQADGRLRIQPQGIISAAEVLTSEDRRRVQSAFKCKVFDTYGATEYTPIAAECESGSKHLVEDGAVIEVEEDRLLLTVFKSRTQPLIRYAINDVVRLVEGECRCGRPHQMIESVEGRAEDTLVFPGRDLDRVSVHPSLFHGLLDSGPGTAWQVVDESDALRIRLQGLSNPAQESEVVRIAVQQMLTAAGARALPIYVETVQEFDRGSTGKVSPIVNRKPPSA